MLTMLFGCSKEAEMSIVSLEMDDKYNLEARCRESALPSNWHTFYWQVANNRTAKINIGYLIRSGENNPVIYRQIEDYYNSAGNFIPGGNFKRIHLYAEYKKPCGETITIRNNSEVSMPVGIDYGWTTLVAGNNVTNRGLSTYRVLLRLKVRVSSGQYATSPVFSFTPLN